MSHTFDSGSGGYHVEAPNMKKLIPFAAGSVGVIAVSMAVFGTGIAAATDAYAGQTYADASSALTGAGLKGVIASRVGDMVPDAQCVVTRSEKAPWIGGSGSDFAPVKDKVLLYLNCNATVASPATPGNSAASPEGRAAIAAANQAAAQDQATAAANQNQPKH